MVERGMCKYPSFPDLAFLLSKYKADGADGWTPLSKTSPETYLFDFVSSHKSNQLFPGGGSLGRGSEAGPSGSDVAGSVSESDDSWRLSSTVNAPASQVAVGRVMESLPQGRNHCLEALNTSSSEGDPGSSFGSRSDC